MISEKIKKIKYTFLNPSLRDKKEVDKNCNIACEDINIMQGDCRCFNEYQKLPGVKKIITTCKL